MRPDFHAAEAASAASRALAYGVRIGQESGLCLAGFLAEAAA
jgi:hypothetical protein